MRILLNITGSSYPSNAKQLSPGRTVNFYPEFQDDLLVNDFILSPWPGAVSFGSSSGLDRGMLAHRGVLYKVSGITLYSVNNLGTHTSLGTIVASTMCILTGYGNGVLIANGSGKVYFYNGATLSEITDADLETPNSVAVLNQHAIYDGDDGRFMVSASGDPTDINALDTATAESSADDLVRAYVFQQRLWLYGRRTIEPWFNSGVGRPPFDRIDGGIITIGLASRMSVNNNDTYMYFLADDRRVYRCTERAEPVSTIALAKTFEKYTTVDDAIGFCFTYNNQNFYHLSFPTEDKTWLYSEPTGLWFELARSATTGRDLANSYAHIFGKHLIGDYSDSNIFQWDIDTHTENGSAIHRERTTGVFHSGLLGDPGKQIELTRFELILERGVGDVTTTDPQVMLQISTDAGRTFGTEMWGSVGGSGEFQQRLYWTGLGRAEQFTFKVTTSDPVLYSIHSANADIDLGI